jgi:hypothetical protein
MRFGHLCGSGWFVIAMAITLSMSGQENLQAVAADNLANARVARSLLLDSDA